LWSLLFAFQNNCPALPPHVALLSSPSSSGQQGNTTDFNSIPILILSLLDLFDLFDPEHTHQGNASMRSFFSSPQLVSQQLNSSLLPSLSHAEQRTDAREGVIGTSRALSSACHPSLSPPSPFFPAAKEEEVPLPAAPALLLVWAAADPGFLSLPAIAPPSAAEFLTSSCQNWPMGA
jgi:hypothetical protein